MASRNANAARQLLGGINALNVVASCIHAIHAMIKLYLPERDETHPMRGHFHPRARKHRRNGETITEQTVSVTELSPGKICNQYVKLRGPGAIRHHAVHQPHGGIMSKCGGISFLCDLHHTLKMTYRGSWRHTMCGTVFTPAATQASEVGRI